jgi:hypothetical protein
MAALTPLGMPRQSIVVAAARMVVAGRVTVDDMALLSRYYPRSFARATLHEHRQRGLLTDTHDPDAFTPSDAFREGSAVVLKFQAEEAARLWQEQAEHLPEIAFLAVAHIDAAVGSDAELPAFRRQVELHSSVPDSPAAQLLGFVTELRYLRADVHAHCLDEHGLSGPLARVVHRAWRGYETKDVSPDVLESAATWTTTDKGRDACEAAEEATNELFAELIDGVDESSRARFLDGLRSLPGEDPRPPEDRA